MIKTLHFGRPQTPRPQFLSRTIVRNQSSWNRGPFRGTIIRQPPLEKKMILKSPEKKSDQKLPEKKQDDFFSLNNFWFYQWLSSPYINNSNMYTEKQPANQTNTHPYHNHTSDFIGTVGTIGAAHAINTFSQNRDLEKQKKEEETKKKEEDDRTTNDDDSDITIINHSALMSDHSASYKTNIIIHDNNNEVELANNDSWSDSGWGDSGGDSGGSGDCGCGGSD